MAPSLQVGQSRHSPRQESVAAISKHRYSELGALPFPHGSSFAEVGNQDPPAFVSRDDGVRCWPLGTRTENTSSDGLEFVLSYNGTSDELSRSRSIRLAFIFPFMAGLDRRARVSPRTPLWQIVPDRITITKRSRLGPRSVLLLRRVHSI